MPKIQKFPSEQELKKMRDLLAQGPAARPLRPNADLVEKMKHTICAEFVLYKNKHRVTQKQMAIDLGIDEALMSKIINYAYDDFTIDRLVKYLSVLYPKMVIRLLIGTSA